MVTSRRKVFGCRNYPSEKECNVAISGTEEEVLDEAVQHAMTKHGKMNNPHLREQLRTMLEDKE
jgi:hypothetical protein